MIFNESIGDDTISDLEPSIRPGSFSEFIGQKDIVSNLQVFIKAAQIRNEPLDHILFSGPPGLGKTTLARIIAALQKGEFRQVSAPNLKRPGDVVKILSGLGKNDTLFIDEIHRLSTPVEEVLYSAMEDNQVDITLSDGLGAMPIQLDIPPFTLVGATTRPGNLTAPLRDRFGIHLRLDYYNEDEIVEILKNAALKWGISYENEAIVEIARRSRRTPRVSLKLLRRIWDYAIAHNNIQDGIINLSIANGGFQQMQIDNLGLTALDNKFLQILAENFQGGPVGLKPLSAALSEDVVTLEEFVEPFMIRLDLVHRTSRGRVITQKGYGHINFPAPIHGQRMLYE
ncbi:MAG: Holliday junction branch migration DNA helicase RuvB [Spirochaetia bacterium]|nr:Holliday junction branch migration DNA helicase RuvB [Spirochaetia bacterium]